MRISGVGTSVSGGKCPAVCPPTGVAACWYLAGRCRRSLDSFQPGRHRTCRLYYLYWQHCCRPGWSLAVRGGSHSRAFHTTHHRCNIYIFIRINCSFENKKLKKNKIKRKTHNVSKNTMCQMHTSLTISTAEAQDNINIENRWHGNA